MGKTTTDMQLVPIGKLVPYANNARTHSSEQGTKLRSSFREFGFIGTSPGSQPSALEETPTKHQAPNHPPDGGLGVVEANGCFFESGREIDGHEGKILHRLRLDHERGADEVPLPGRITFGDGNPRKLAADVQGEPYGSLRHHRAGEGTHRADSPLEDFGCR